MSLETVADSIKGLLESVRKGPLIAFLLLLMGQNVFQMLRNDKLEEKLNDTQEKRVAEGSSVMREKNRTIELLDTIQHMKDAHIKELIEALKDRRK